jgi:mRNA (guanine-N7-)-methyltransferase
MHTFPNFFSYKLISLSLNPECDILPSTCFRLAEKYGLQLVAKERFDDYYEKAKEEGRSLLGKMQALEVRV